MALPSHEDFFYCAAKVATLATCTRAKCGSVIVKNGSLIAEGFNGPPMGDPKHRCGCTLDQSPKIKSDRTCCVHAEWRAILNALKASHDLRGATLYFSRCDDAGTLLKSGEPYCTVCSRLALESGLAYFGLWQDTGIRIFDTAEYNELSYQFHLTANLQ